MHRLRAIAVWLRGSMVAELRQLFLKVPIFYLNLCDFIFFLEPGAGRMNTARKDKVLSNP